MEWIKSDSFKMVEEGYENFLRGRYISLRDKIFEALNIEKTTCVLVSEKTSPIDREDVVKNLCKSIELSLGRMEQKGKSRWFINDKINTGYVLATAKHQKFYQDGDWFFTIPENFVEKISFCEYKNILIYVWVMSRREQELIVFPLRLYGIRNLLLSEDQEMD